MVSKDGKLVILEDIVVNKNYSKYKRIEKFINSKNSVKGDSGSSIIRDAQSSMDVDILMCDEELMYESEIKNKEKKEKDVSEMTKEEIAYNIIKSIDNSFLNDRYVSMSKVIPSRFQKYWDGLDTLVAEKLRGYDGQNFLIESNRKSVLSKIIDSLSKYSRDLKSYLFSSSKKSVVEVMEHMKSQLETLDTDEEIIDKLDKYINLIKKLDNNPSLFKSAIKLTVLSSESRILKNGKFLKYLSEDQIVKFVRMSERGLSISYLNEYNRNIPKEAIGKFNEAEEIEAFDNYIILHYSSKDESKKKNEESDKKRDPIMFGLIKGSRKLYYICDWIDEYCDLTLDSLIDKIGESYNNLYE